MRYGFLPLNVRLLLNVEENECLDNDDIKSNKNCLFRYGSVNDSKKSFYDVNTHIYFIYNHQTLEYMIN